ncbi:MAG TPA: protoglobin domain-containing protein [Planctomycetota bacterium]|nr:protoglobin domain-containing protein [Planctomycetota bacterium]
MTKSELIASHVRYVGLSATDIEALRSVRTLVEAHADAFVARFYAHLRSFEGTRAFLTDEATVQRLLVGQKKYLLSLVDANFDEKYYDFRRVIGQTHFRIGLDFQWYIGAYVLYLDFFFPLFMKHCDGDTEATIRIQSAFRRATLLDMSIVLEAYHEGDKAALAASKAQVLHQEKLAAIGLLSSGLAHEIGNPLASIQAVCDNQLRKNLDPQIAEKFQRIHGQVGRIVGIVRQLVNFARRDPHKWRPVSINEEIEAALAIARLSRLAKNVETECVLDPQLPVTVAIGDQLSQVFLNLFLNAFDAMREEGGHLSVRSAAADGVIEVTIEDNGVGIAPENIKNLFVPFYTTKETGKGTGLGLHVSDGIIKRHGGEIRVESRQNEGAVFTVLIPIRNDPPEIEHS